MIEKTSKPIKKKIALASLVGNTGLFIFGLGCILHIRTDEIYPVLILLGLLCGIVGGFMMLSAIIKRWWHHG